MKLLHTSDWHLGQLLMKCSRESEHKGFIDFLVETVEERQVDTLIVAGDIFDTATPPSYAREMYHHTLFRLNKSGLKNLIVVAGNHDSVSVMEESQPILSLLNIHVITRPYMNPAEAVIPLYDKAGGLVGLFCAVPFLRQRDLVESEAGLNAKKREEKLLKAIQQYYQQTYQVACQQRGNQSIPILASGHLTVIGGRVSDSERDIYIGTLEAVPADVFPPFDYLALGHLHACQQVNVPENLGESRGTEPRGPTWYSGSPIPMSFSEANKQKFMLEVVFDSSACGQYQDDLEKQSTDKNSTQEGGGEQASLFDEPENKLNVQVNKIPVPNFQKLLTLRGDTQALLNECQQLAAESAKVWLNLEVTSRESLHVFRDQLADVCRDTDIEVLCLKRDIGPIKSSEARYLEDTLQSLTHEDVFLRRLQAEDLEEEEGDGLAKLYHRLVEEMVEEQEQEPES